MSDKTKGQTSVGPSKEYMRLLRGESSAKQYADRVKKTINRQVGSRQTGRSAAGGAT